MKHPESKIAIKHRIKIYGDQPHAPLKLFRAGETRDSIFKATESRLGFVPQPNLRLRNH